MDVGNGAPALQRTDQKDSFVALDCASIVCERVTQIEISAENVDFGSRSVCTRTAIRHQS